ncbi:MAG: site-2 protease family protein [Pseudomonadota bacterium]
MAAVLTEIVRFFILIVRVPIEVLFRVRSKEYRTEVVINADRATVFRVLRATEQKIDGLVEMTITQHPRPGSPGVFDGRITVGDQTMALAFRETEVRENELIVTDILEDGTDPALYRGDNYKIIMVLSDGDPEGSTRLQLIYMIDHSDFGGRFTIPMGMSTAARRIKRMAETEAGAVEADAPKAPVWNAVATGAVTLASFWVLFDLQFAVVLLLVLLLHELGHVVAMRWVGLPVRGIYFIPFMGAVAVGMQGFGTEAKRGFIAVMGPAASVLTTAVFVLLAEGSTTNIWFSLALISAFLNGFNLLPFLPLDGGQIIGALLSRAGDEARRFVQLVFMLSAIALALYVESYFLLALFVIVGATLISRPAPGQVLPAIDWSSAFWLTVAYVATLAFYVFVVLNLSLEMRAKGQRGIQLGGDPSTEARRVRSVSPSPSVGRAVQQAGRRATVAQAQFRHRTGSTRA